MNFNLIGVTGTNGKTSVTYFVSKVLESAGRLTGIIGTIKNTVGEREFKAEKLNPTTPDAIELQQSFKEIAEAGASDVVMEVTSSALDKERVYGCDFNIGAFTNLTQDHLEEHGTMENYKNAKLKLFKMCRKAIINADESVSKEIREIATGEVYTYGIEQEADFVVSTSDNPRYEDQMSIIEDIEVGILKTNCNYFKDANRKEAIFKALDQASIGDVVILAGKGHETYQIIGEDYIHFNDREVVEEYFDYKT